MASIRLSRGILLSLLMCLLCTQSRANYFTDQFPGQLTTALKCKLTGDKIVDTDLAQGDTGATGKAYIKVYTQGSVFNVLFKIKVSSLRGTLPPTNQSIWFGPAGTIGTLAAVIDGTWTLGNNQPSASTCLKANSGCTTVFTSWIVAADSSNAGYQFVQAIATSPKAYYLQVFSDKFPDGALRCQYTKPLFLGFILSWFSKG